MAMDSQTKTWTSLPAMFFDQAKRHGEEPFLSVKKDGNWHHLSWNEVAKRIARLAEGLTALGIKTGDRVAILSENRPEWVIADIAIMALGAISVPLYTTYTTRDHLHALENSGSKAIIVSKSSLTKTVLPAAHQLDCLRTAILMEPYKITQHLNLDILNWQDVLGTQEGNVAALIEGLAIYKRTDNACIIFTSGTGGSPKGVVLSHGSILHNCEGALDVMQAFKFDLKKFLSFLPLSHAYEHTGGLFLPIIIGCQIYYSESLEKLGANMIEVKPTAMLVVPRLFEMIKGRIETALEKEGGKKKKLFQRTLELGTKKFQNPGSLTVLERIENKCLDLLVRKKVLKRFGGKIQAFVSGGAALNLEVGTFFAALGIRLLQGYGLTETGPLISVTRPPNNKIGSVGPPVKNTEVKIADDGEILVRGELVMSGYWLDLDATDKVIKDGWFHTGDIGEIDSDGDLRITDRKKDIIVFDKGDNVSPQRIEGLLTLEPEIAQAMVYGDAHPYLVGLITPDPDWLAKWAKGEGKERTLEALQGDKDLLKAVGEAVTRVNVKLSNIERVRRFTFAKEPFSVENKQMTPTLKIRRHVLKEVYRDDLEGLY
ncbi:MAG: long-chain fatty acid--CoA ligase [Sphingomonadales bacterium]